MGRSRVASSALTAVAKVGFIYWWIDLSNVGEEDYVTNA